MTTITSDIRLTGFIMEANLLEPAAPYYGDPEVYRVVFQPDDLTILPAIERLAEDYQNQVKTSFHLRNPDAELCLTHNYQPVEDGTCLVFQTKHQPKIDASFNYITRDEEWSYKRATVVGSVFEQPDNLLLTIQFLDPCPDVGEEEEDFFGPYDDEF